MACFQTWQQVSTEWALNLSISSIFKSGRCKPLPHASSKNLLLNYIHFLTTYLPRLSNIDYGTWTSKANQANIIPSHTVCTSGGWTPKLLTFLLLYSSSRVEGQRVWKRYGTGCYGEGVRTLFLILFCSH